MNFWRKPAGTKCLLYNAYTCFWSRYIFFVCLFNCYTKRAKALAFPGRQKVEKPADNARVIEINFFTSLGSDLKHGGKVTRGQALSSASKADDVLVRGAALMKRMEHSGEFVQSKWHPWSQIRVTNGSAMRWNAAVCEVRPHTCAIPPEIPRYYYYARPAITWNAAKTTAAGAR